VVVYVNLDSPDSIGPILFHHKELAEHLAEVACTQKNMVELCERVGEQNLFTT
jgi:hypothetical protein